MSARNLFDMFFTPSLGGLNLGFSEKDRRLAETVHSIAFSEIKQLPKASETEPDCEKDDNDVTSPEKIELSKKNLGRIFEILENGRGTRKEFLENFPDWMVLRKETIQKLMEIEQTMQNEKYWCNIFKMAGHVVFGAGTVALASSLILPVAPVVLSGIVAYTPSFLLSSLGGATAVSTTMLSGVLAPVLPGIAAGVAAPALTGVLAPVLPGIVAGVAAPALTGVSAPVIPGIAAGVAGTVATGAGGVAAGVVGTAAAGAGGIAASVGGIATCIGGVSTLGTKATEIFLLRQRMEAAKKVLQGDKIAFVYMENWFKHTKELIDAIEDILGFDVMKQLYEDIDALFLGIKRIEDLEKKSPRWLKAAVKLCLRQILRGKLFAKYLGDGLTAAIVTFMFVVVFLSRKNRFIFKCIVKTKQLTNEFGFDKDAVSDLAGVIAAVGVGGYNVIQHLTAEAAREVSFGIFAGLGIAISAANIVLTSIDIRSGSTCKQRADVKRAAEKLQEELDLLEKVYNTMDTTVVSEQNFLTNEMQDLEEKSHRKHASLQESDSLNSIMSSVEKNKQNLVAEFKKTIQEAKTSAQMASLSKNHPPRIHPPTKPVGILLKKAISQDFSNYENNKSLIKNALKTKNPILKNKGFRKLSDDGRIIASSDEIPLVKDTLTRDNDKNMEGKFEFVIPNQRFPQIILYNINKEVDAVYLGAGLLEKNIFLADSENKPHFIVDFAIPARNKKLNHWVLQIHPEKFNEIIEKEGLYFEWYWLRLAEFVSVRQCRKCLAFGLTTRNCTEKHKESWCDRCGNLKKEGHKCHAVSCINCIEANNRSWTGYGRNHSCYDKNHSTSVKRI